MNMDRSEMIRCAAMSGIPTLHFVLTDFCGIAHRAYIETAMNGSPPTGVTLAIAVVPMPLTDTSCGPGWVNGRTRLNRSTTTRSDSFTTIGQRS